MTDAQQLMLMLLIAGSGTGLIAIIFYIVFTEDP